MIPHYKNTLGRRSTPKGFFTQFSRYYSHFMASNGATGAPFNVQFNAEVIPRCGSFVLGQENGGAYQSTSTVF